MDVQRLAVDVHQLIYGRAILHKWTFISFSMDVQHDIRGRPPVSLWTYKVWSRTSTTYYMNVQHFISGCPSVSLRVVMDVHQLLYGRTKLHKWTSISFCMDVQRVAVDVHQLLYGCPTLHKWTSISFSKDVQHNICGRPPVSI